MYYNTFRDAVSKVVSWESCLLIGFLLVLVLATIKRPEDFPVTRFGIFFCTILMACFGLMGAKLLFMFLHWEELLKRGDSLTQYFAVSGYAYLGALIFEIITVFAFVKIRIKRISFLNGADYALPFIMLHQVFVRIGCFLTGCCYGKTTNLPWGCAFEPGADVLRHPTQIYSASFLILIFFVTRYIYKRGHITGTVFFSGLCMYGFFRFLVEFLRVDSPYVLGIFTLAQVVTLSIGLISVAVLRMLLHAKKNDSSTTHNVISNEVEESN